MCFVLEPERNVNRNRRREGRVEGGRKRGREKERKIPSYEKVKQK